MPHNELQHVEFDSLTEYVLALDKICALPTHSLMIFEKDFADLGFNSEFRFNTLRQFLLSNSKVSFKMLAHSLNNLERHCPRLILLDRQFSHLMQIRQIPANLRHLTSPFALSDDLHSVRRFHFDHPHGIFAKNDPASNRLWTSRFEEMWAVSVPSQSTQALNL